MRRGVQVVSSRQPVVERVGGLLAASPLAWKIGATGVRAVAQPLRRRQIARYLDSCDCPRLRLGAGRHGEDGWLCGDLIPTSRRVVYMDARRPFPLPTGCLQVVATEHLIEHVSFAEAESMLAECKRVLAPGGVLRIATPDLGRLMALACQEERAPEFAAYVDWSNRQRGDVPPDQLANPVYAINQVVRAWGHTFLYDEATLSASLERAGFTNIKRFAPGESDRPDLRGVERHGEVVGEDFNRLETMVLQATTG